jgi:hypothetical protein
MRASFWAPLAVLAACGCGGKSAPPSEPRVGSAAEVDDIVTDAEADPSYHAAAGKRAAAAEAVDTSTLIAGHHAARYQLAVPAGLRRLRGVLAHHAEDARQLSDQGPDGVGLPSPHDMSFDSIVVFSDPLGLGVDARTVPAAQLDDIVAQYGEIVRARVPSAASPKLAKIGPHAAIRVELPRVEMPDRPVRAGRHYLVLDGSVTVAVDCLWTKVNAERMAAACDAVAASLRRHR